MLVWNLVYYQFQENNVSHTKGYTYFDAISTRVLLTFKQILPSLWSAISHAVWHDYNSDAQTTSTVEYDKDPYI